MPSATAPQVPEHVVRFYETDAELVAAAGRFLSTPPGAAAVVIATPAHAAALAGEHAVVLDAAETLSRFTVAGRLDRPAFRAVVGGVLRDAAATGRPVKAFGEMVALLWEAGDVEGAIALESLWNELATEVSFSLFCAYPSQLVRGQEEALERVCRLHSAVVPGEESWRFEAEPSAPARARDHVVEALRRMGHAGLLLDNARLVTSELATNAVRYAGSPFSVSVRDGATVRVLVRDASSVMPRPHAEPGRGLDIVRTLARRWGADPAPGGKVVWADLR